MYDQCKEIEKNNRIGKTRDLFKKIRDTKGTFHEKRNPKTTGEVRVPRPSQIASQINLP